MNSNSDSPNPLALNCLYLILAPIISAIITYFLVNLLAKAMLENTVLQLISPIIVASWPFAIVAWFVITLVLLAVMNLATEIILFGFTRQ